MRRLIACLALLAALFPFSKAHAWETDYVDPQRLLSDEDLTDTVSMTKNDLGALLAKGFLGNYKTKDARGKLRPALEIIWSAAREFTINPRFLAVLLQREQGLIEDPSPTQDQLDWAMGYALCDDCNKSDPRLKKYKGFGVQVHGAAKRIRESYLADLKKYGRTQSGIGVGIPAVIDEIKIIPKTLATAILYTYTPHVFGNANFVRIWNTWFTPAYPSGALLQDAKTGGVWLIRNEQRYLLASKTVLITSFHGRAIAKVKSGVLNAYPVGAALVYPNYSLLRTPDGNVFLIVDDTVRAFASTQLVRQLGFDPDEIVDVGKNDLGGYVEGPAIENPSSPPEVTLMQDTKTGGVYAVESGIKHPIPSPEVLKTRYGSRILRPADGKTLATLQNGPPIPFPDGTLVAVKDSKDIFVISEGKRRKIMDEKAFLAYGWRKNQIVYTDTKTLALHTLGDEINL